MILRTFDVKDEPRANPDHVVNLAEAFGGYESYLYKQSEFDAVGQGGPVLPIGVCGHTHRDRARAEACARRLLRRGASPPEALRRAAANAREVN